MSSIDPKIVESIRQMRQGLRSGLANGSIKTIETNESGGVDLALFDDEDPNEYVGNVDFDEVEIPEERQIDLEELIEKANNDTPKALARVDFIEGEIMPSADELVERAVRLNQQIGMNYFELGMVCREIVNCGVPEQLGYKDRLEDFFQDKVGLHYRKARYLIGIARTFIEADVPMEQVTAIGWSKAKELIDVPTEKLVPLLEAAPNMTVDEVKNKAKAAKKLTADASVTPKKVMHTMTFKLFEDQFEVAENALNRALDVYKTDNRAIAFSRLMGDWMINQPEAPSIDSLRSYVRETYGLDIVPFDNEE